MSPELAMTILADAIRLFVNDKTAPGLNVVIAQAINTVVDALQKKNDGAEHADITEPTDE